MCVSCVYVYVWSRVEAREGDLGKSPIFNCNLATSGQNFGKKCGKTFFGAYNPMVISKLAESEFKARFMVFLGRKKKLELAPLRKKKTGVEFLGG